MRAIPSGRTGCTASPGAKPIVVRDSSQPGIELVYYHADICSRFLLRGTDTWRSGNSLQVKVEIVNDRELVLQWAEWQQCNLSRRHIHKPAYAVLAGSSRRACESP